MKLAALFIRNFRTINSLDLTFPTSYSALCGPNDSGKTNVVNAIRALIRLEEDQYLRDDDDEVSVKDDFPKWLGTPENQRVMEIGCHLEVHETRDAGLYQFLIRQLQLSNAPALLTIELKAAYSADPKPQPRVSVTFAGRTFDGIEAQEVFKRLQTSRSILVHDSPQSELVRYRFRHGFGEMRELSGEAASELQKLKRDVEKKLQRIARGQQEELEGLLGRLEKKYKVGVSVSSIDLGWVPYNLTLGDSKHDVRLDNWGSGTQNRTMILSTIFRAKKLGEAEVSAEKITPLIIVEEPESFLHPYAQAEFGRVLQDLAEEFQIQVLVTTHSPYMLSLNRPLSNVLLSRRAHYGQLRETQLVDTHGDNWMEPFGQALGMSSEEFKPWQRLFGSNADSVLLVEGDCDVEYFDMLRDGCHGAAALAFEGDIISYDGVGTLKNTVLLRFIKNRYKRMFLTFDLDMKTEVERCISPLGLKREIDYLPIGLDIPGKRAIEGLLPDRVSTAVHASHSDLVMAATSGTKDERESAKSALKRKYLKEFRATAKPGQADFGEFYKVARFANRALKS